ncbi:hypothetical protein FRC03_005160 [Tulasnella sp. 419]|nr:hypothetical protein FRC03_005160 [Tulasnella sp. 419]
MEVQKWRCVPPPSRVQSLALQSLAHIAPVTFGISSAQQNDLFGEPNHTSSNRSYSDITVKGYLARDQTLPSTEPASFYLEKCPLPSSFGSSPERPQASDAIAKEAVAIHGRVDVLVINAAYILVGAIEGNTPEETSDQCNTNIFGVLNVSRAFLPYVRERRSGTVFLGEETSTLVSTAQASSPFEGLQNRCSSSWNPLASEPTASNQATSALLS